jgi:pyrroloquinoline quinone biosynthesis protein E
LLLLDPAGQALPCHAAGVIPGMRFDNVRQHSLDWIWRESAAFQRFRGEDWMPEPCRSCEHRGEDFGGCRCQAFLLTGDAAGTDPVCTLAPKHGVVEQALEQISSAGTPVAVPTSAAMWVYRPNPG